MSQRSKGYAEWSADCNINEICDVNYSRTNVLQIMPSWTYRMVYWNLFFGTLLHAWFILVVISMIVNSWAILFRVLLRVNVLLFSHPRLSSSHYWLRYITQHLFLLFSYFIMDQCQLFARFWYALSIKKTTKKYR